MPEIHLFDRDPDPVVLRAGEVLFSPGDAAEELFAVIEGEIELTVDGVAVEVAGPGSVFGEVALVDSGPRSGGAVARTEAKLARVDRRRFTFVVQEHPTFALRVMEIMAARLRRNSLPPA